MIYLILAIVSTIAISVFMRLSDKYVKNNMVMFAANYLICGLLSFTFHIVDSGSFSFTVADATGGELTFALILGVVGGILYLASFMLLQFNIQKNGVVLASTFMKLGMLVPVVMSVALLWDKPTVLQIIGCVLAVAAVIIINGEGSGKNASFSGIWLVVLLVVSGFTDSLANIYDKLGAPKLKNQYLLFIFISAMIISIVFIFVKKQRFTFTDAMWGMIIGVPNYFSSRFLLLSLSDVPAIVTYPVFNISAILFISLLGFLLFKEKLSRRKLIGMAVIIAAILLLSLKV